MHDIDYSFLMGVDRLAPTFSSSSEGTTSSLSDDDFIDTDIVSSTESIDIFSNLVNVFSSNYVSSDNNDICQLVVADELHLSSSSSSELSFCSWKEDFLALPRMDSMSTGCSAVASDGLSIENKKFNNTRESPNGKRKLSHTKPWCSICCQEFSENSKLRRHIARFHSVSDIKFPCQRGCGKSYNTDFDMKSHVRLCGVTFVCECGCAFKSDRTYRYHLSKTGHAKPSSGGLVFPIASACQPEVISHKRQKVAQ